MNFNLFKYFAILLFLSVGVIAIAQNTTQGEWGGVLESDMIPVAAANLPDGKILVWSAFEKMDFHSRSTNAGKTYVSIYNPVNNSFSTTLVTNTGHDMFCPGTANLDDGRIMITGGAANAITTFYNPATNAFSKGSDMQEDRGYHSTCTLTDGDVFAIGGSWSVRKERYAEVWNKDSGWNFLNNVLTSNTVRQGTSDPKGIYRDDNHAWIFAAPDGDVYQLGPDTAMHYITTSGEGSVVDKGDRGDDSYAMNGTATMYDKGKVLTAGGAASYTFKRIYMHAMCSIIVL